MKKDEAITRAAPTPSAAQAGDGAELSEEEADRIIFELGMHDAARRLVEKLGYSWDGDRGWIVTQPAAIRSAGLTDEQLEEVGESVGLGPNISKEYGRALLAAIPTAAEARREALEEAAQACCVIAISMMNEHNISIGVAEDLKDVAYDCVEAIRALTSTQAKGDAP